MLPHIVLSDSVYGFAQVLVIAGVVNGDEMPFEAQLLEFPMMSERFCPEFMRCRQVNGHWRTFVHPDGCTWDHGEVLRADIVQKEEDLADVRMELFMSTVTTSLSSPLSSQLPGLPLSLFATSRLFPEWFRAEALEPSLMSAI